MIYRGFKYRLNPTTDQVTTLKQHASVCRLVYNLALEQRRDFWRPYLRANGRHINFASQCRELTLLRDQFDWIGAVTATCQEQALRDLDRAYQYFFKGRRGHPTPRRKGLNESFRLKGREVRIRRLNSKWSMVRLSKIGWVKFRDTRNASCAIKNATVSLDSTGWYISFLCEIEHAAPSNNMPSVGIDRGVINTITLSTGERLSLPATLNEIEGRHRRAQRVLARRKKGSMRRLKQRRRCAKLSAKRVRIRKDWHHKAALSIAKRFGCAVLEDLKVVNMTASAAGTIDNPGSNVRQKASLNRSILNQGWGVFEAILTYKLEERGGTIVKVSPAYTSQACASCGTIDRKSRESQASFFCHHCGHRDNADVNAAINILRRNTAWPRVEVGLFPARETRTMTGITPKNRQPSVGEDVDSAEEDAAA